MQARPVERANMDEYSIIRLKEHLMKTKKSDPSHLQTDFRHFVKNYTLDFDFYFNEYLKYRTFVDETLLKYIDKAERNRM
jgi:hypothetical protein